MGFYGQLWQFFFQREAKYNLNQKGSNTKIIIVMAHVRHTFGHVYEH